MATPVDTLITDARSFAKDTNTAAVAALDQMRHDIGNIGFTVIGFNAPVLPTKPKIPDVLVAPVLDTITLDLPPDPGNVPVFQDISAIDAGTAPVLTAAVPTLTLPSKPSDVAAFTASLPGLTTSFNFPTAPVLDAASIQAPVLVDRVAPTRPQVSLPAFDAQRPGDLAPAPTDYADRFIAAYKDAQPNMVAALDGYLDTMLARYNPNYKAGMASLEAQLAKYLAGGTALNADVENAIYERSRGKGNAEYLRTRGAAWEDAAKRGHTLPDGVLYAGLGAARQDAADLNAAGAREIVVMQAEMEQKNLQFAVSTSLDLRKTVLSASLSYHSNLVQLNGQAVEYASKILSAIVQVYDSAVKAYQARADVYRAEATVYETRLKAAMAGIELYQADIRALEALARVDMVRVEVYKARIDVLQSLAQIYRSQIDAVVAQASIERLKVDVFQAQVQAYSATVNAKQAEYQGYTAAIGGEEAKVRVYSEQVRGFLANVQGYQAVVTAKAEVVRAAAISNEARARQYSALLSGYTAVVQARGEKARTQLETQRQLITAFQATANAQEANARLQSDWYKSIAQIVIENTKLGTQVVIEGAKLNLEQSKAVAAAGTSSAEVYGHVASSALSGINTLVSQQLTQ
jgi:hypothetical protein